ncbi:Glycosyl phosphatidyl inositol anchor synthesis [Microsporum canis]
MSRTGLFLALAVLFHLIYTYSIFDIYFVSPIVSGMREYGVERAPEAKAPAKRLVLFVGDGLRADKAFQYFPDPSPPQTICSRDDEGSIACPEPDLTPKPLAPFLRSRVLEHGTFGVSHTRVPTESRPGHVALIAGLYEDVSAVTTGWKLNPVNFDSVFNRSRHTWSWGSPDILPMFKEGAVPGRISVDMYSEEDEDFTRDATVLDTWVFDRVKEMFATAKEDKNLDAQLRDDKVVFFLHLLGLDTTGHFYRPYSKEYLHNIQVVDQGVREITELIDDFYGDEETAFVFTADHGMSDWGSHGDGHPDNTRTPLIVWGSGVAKPVKTNGAVAPGHEDGFSSDWHLNNIKRHDVAQADVAALMAYLIGLDFPVNSVGELPLSYLDATPREKAKAALANTQGVLEMYRVKEEQKRAATIRYQGYTPFTQPQRSPEAQLAAIRKLISTGKYEQSILQSRSLFQDALDGLRYLQTYDWLFLRAIVTAGYLGWISYALVTVIDLHVLPMSLEPDRSIPSFMFFSSVLVVLYSVLWVQQSTWRYYAYAFFPVLFWEEVFARRAALGAGQKVLLGHVKSFTGTYGGILMFGIGMLYLIFEESILSSSKVKTSTGSTFNIGSRIVMGAQIGIILLSIIVTRSSIASLQARTGLPLGNQVTGWIAMISSFVLPVLHKFFPTGHYLHRLIVLFLTFAPTFIVLTISYEGLFYVVYFATLVSWVRLEHSIYRYTLPPKATPSISREATPRAVTTDSGAPATTSYRTLNLPDARIALFFLFLLQSGFFSTGNIASISSFSLDSVSRLIPVFNPFSQGALLILKILVPFALLSATFGILNRRLHVAPSALFMIVMCISDVMTLNFFFMVRDEGSWLDIGTTISHFCISSGLCVFVAIIESLSGAFISGVNFDGSHSQENQLDATEKSAVSD